MGCSTSIAGEQKKKLDNVSSSISTSNCAGVKTIVTMQRQAETCNLSEDGDESNSEYDVLTNHGSVNPSNLINSGRNYMLVIKTNHNRTKGVFVNTDFQNAALLLNEIVSFLLHHEPSTYRSDMQQKLTQEAKENQIVEIYCKICAEILESGSSSVYPGLSPEHIEPVHTMLWYLLNCSDENSVLSGIISQQTHFLNISTGKLQQWTAPHFSGTDVKSVEGSDILEWLMTILHNIAMFEDNVPKVRDVNCIEAMKPYLDSKDNTIRLLCLATLADLVNESESEILKSNSEVFTFLMWTISMAMENEERNYDGWSLVELARIVHQVARNDNNKRTVVQHGAVPLLVKISDSGNIEEQREAVRAIWTLSFDEKNRTEMIETEKWKVIETLEKMSQSSDQTVKRISNKALWTITDHQKSLQTRIGGLQDGKPIGNANRHIMISYNWGHQPMVKQIRDSLRNSGIKVWMDVDDMQGSTLQAMAKAVEQADIVLVCYSFKYKNSDNCRAEAEYAFQLKKKIIPLKMEMNYKADGWLGLIIGAKLFYDFSGKYPFEKKTNELIREILEALNRSTKVLVEVPDHVVKSHQEPILQAEIPVMSGAQPKEGKTTVINTVRKWTPSQVEKWLDNNSLPKKLLGRLRGKDVAFLRLLVQECPSTFYQTIRDQLDLKDVKSMSDFRFALEDLDTDAHSSSSL
ncbi:uncharacterized protein LOC127726075 [Mytilus californianus]|uniref:uncharacterized protein LOC127726075 n=1 Tax=Mytilus californianus TaxID=6549 RepID=UPI002247BD76|nr:uncharacterized protein LOC127726075 [Mytilus californianus]XP_052089372.1 uncharacterized protein LOC127726075 [Mytilus californianus]